MLRHDLRQALRALRRTPGITAAAILTLALGVGANAAVFSAFNALLLRPLPIGGIDRVVFGFALRDGFDPFGTSLLEYDAYRRRARTLDRTGIATPRDVTITTFGEPQRLQAAAVSAGFLDALAVTPALGRLFSDAEDRPDAALVVILSAAVWRRHFGADPLIVGRGIRVDGAAATVVGVMTEGFDFPYGNGVWLPLRIDVERLPPDQRTPSAYAMIGRLRPDATIAGADAELRQIARALEEEYPAARRGWTYRVVPLRQQILGDLDGRTGTSLRALLAGVALLLVMCCANVAGLMLVRRAGRQGDIAIHAALGASRWRIGSQALVESAVLAVLGGAAGLLVAAWIAPAIAAFSPIPATAFGTMLRDFSVDGRVVAYGAAVTLVAAAICGIVPALSAQFQAPIAAMKRQPARGGSVANQRWLAAVAVGAVAIAVTLLASGTVLVRSFERLRHMDLGFEANHLMAVDLALPADRFPSHAARTAALEQFRDRVRSAPGVASAGTTTNLPLERMSFDSTYTTDTGLAPGRSDVPITAHRLVGSGYLETLGVRLLRGRLLDAGDRAGARPVAVVSEEFARQAWPGADPLGKRVRQGRPDQTGRPWISVVGVVADVKEDRFNVRVARPVWYLPYSQVENTLTVTMLIRPAGSASAAAAAVRRAILEVDPAQPAQALRAIDETVAEVLVTERFAAILLGTLAALGLVVAATGLYGVMAHTVQRRTAELGLRMALGSRPVEIVALVLRSGARLVAIGLAIGVPGAWGAGHALSSVLYGVNPGDPILLAGVAGTVAGVCAAACGVPALRASRLDPLAALRAD